MINKCLEMTVESVRVNVADCVWQPWRGGEKEGLGADYYSQLCLSQEDLQAAALDVIWEQQHAFIQNCSYRCRFFHGPLLCLGSDLSVKLLIRLAELVNTAPSQRSNPAWASLLRRGAGRTPRSTGCFSVSLNKIVSWSNRTSFNYGLVASVPCYCLELHIRNWFVNSFFLFFRKLRWKIHFSLSWRTHLCGQSRGEQHVIC